MTGKKKGFTLIELLVVIGIICILAAMLLAGIRAVVSRTKKAATITLIKNMDLACKTYFNDWGKYPPDHLNDGSAPTQEEANNMLFRALTVEVSRAGAPSWGPYMTFDGGQLDTNDPNNQDSHIVDSWDQGILYDNNYSEGTDYPEKPATNHLATTDEFDSPETESNPTVDFLSGGPDKVYGTDDDICNWQD